MRRISIFTLITFLLSNSFFPKPFAQELNSFAPEDIQTFLNNNPEVNSADQFLERLPAEFKQHWIMMSRSESTQTGTATSPRFLLPSTDSSIVFGFALSRHPLFPMADPDIIEYLHFLESTNEFRFHEIDMRSRTVIKDKEICQACHSGRPNWDAYDSWGGMLPFNRDRIYENSEEEAAIKRLLKEELRDNPIVKQLELPKGITRNNNGDIIITFDREDRGTDTVDVSYSFENNVLSYPGGEGPVPVRQGGRYLRLHHSAKGDSTDEGRGVALFDNFTNYNARRVAQDLLDFPKQPVDIRFVSLAIARDCPNLVNHTNYAPQMFLDMFRDYHGMSFNDLIEDTRKRRQSLPQLKANLQAENLGGPDPFGLIRENGRVPDPVTITQEVFRRSKESFAVDKLTEHMIDRETYGDETTTIALFRFFLEPLGVAVDRWSLSVLNRGRSQTYTFGDLFSRYTTQIESALENALGPQITCDQLAAASRTVFAGGGITGDIDGDGDVDRDDLRILLQDQGKIVSQSVCGARCDLNGDGQVSSLDAHELILVCTRPQCATQ